MPFAPQRKPRRPSPPLATLGQVGHTCNSILGGLVSITAGCSVFSAPASIAAGFVGAFVYHAASCMMRKLKIDDPLDAYAVGSRARPIAQACTCA